MLKKAVQQGRSEHTEGRRYQLHFVKPFALLHEVLGKRKSPLCVFAIFEEVCLNVEPLSDARTPLAGFFSILLILVHNGFQVAAADHLLIEQPLRSFEERGLPFRQ